MLYLYSDLGTPYGLLVVGIILLVFGVNATITGESRSRFGRVVSRAKDPDEFWQDVTMFYLGGVLLIAYYVHEAYGLPH